MASKQYYIYEIPGVKIGCTNNVKRRVQQQKCTQYKVLETHTDVMEASKREIELQKQYGYSVDTIPYYQTLLNQTTEGCSKAGKKAVESGQIAALGKIQGKKNVESGHTASLGKKYGKIYGKINGKANRKLTFNQAEEIREKFYKMDGGKLVRYDTLASEYNVSPSAIRFIIKNRTYTEQ